MWRYIQNVRDTQFPQTFQVVSISLITWRSENFKNYCIALFNLILHIQFLLWIFSTGPLFSHRAPCMGFSNIISVMFLSPSFTMSTFVIKLTFLKQGSVWHVNHKLLRLSLFFLFIIHLLTDDSVSKVFNTETCKQLL